MHPRLPLPAAVLTCATFAGLLQLPSCKTAPANRASGRQMVQLARLLLLLLLAVGLPPASPKPACCCFCCCMAAASVTVPAGTRSSCRQAKMQPQEMTVIDACQVTTAMRGLRWPWRAHSRCSSVDAMHGGHQYSCSNKHSRYSMLLWVLDLCSSWCGDKQCH